MLALLGATAAAFAVSERLKLEPSPLTKTRVDKVFSPVCECRDPVARISFLLRRSDRLTVEVLDSEHRTVRALAINERFHRGMVRFEWTGKNDAGRIEPDGAYRVRVHLRADNRTINLPNVIRLDTVAPRVVVVSPARPRIFSPDADGNADSVKVRYRVSEPAHGLLYVDGALRVRGRFSRLSDQLAWHGVAHGKPFPPGRYRVTIGARDLAGNLATTRPAGMIVIRYVALSPRVVHARAGKRFAVLVSTDAGSYTWRLGKKSGVGHGRVLTLRAPGPGRHALVVEEHGHAARAVVIVRR